MPQAMAMLRKISAERRKNITTVGRELELTMRLRNNCLRARRLELGLTVSELCFRAHVRASAYRQLENVRLSPVHSAKNPRFLVDPWKPVAKKLARFYRCAPDELWPAVVLEIRKPVVTTEVAGEKAVALARYARTIELPLGPEARLLAAETATQLDALMRDCLTDAEREAVCAKFGFDGRGEQPLRAIAKELPRVGGGTGVSSSRVQQRVKNALRKLRSRIGEKIGRAGPVPWADLTIDRRFVNVEKARLPERDEAEEALMREIYRRPLHVVPNPKPEPVPEDVPDLGADFGEDEGVVWKCSEHTAAVGNVLTELEAVVVFGTGAASLVCGGRPTVPVQVLGSTFGGPLGPMFRPARVCIPAKQVRELYRIANERNLGPWAVHVQITEEHGRAGVILRLVAK